MPDNSRSQLINRSPWKHMAGSALQMAMLKTTLNRNQNRPPFTPAPSVARSFRQKVGQLITPSGTESRSHGKEILMFDSPPCYKDSRVRETAFSVVPTSKGFFHLNLCLRCDGVRIRAPVWRRGGHGGSEYVCAVKGCPSNGAAFSKMYELCLFNIQSLPHRTTSLCFVLGTD